VKDLSQPSFRRLAFVAALMAAAAVGLSACNTVTGAGKDVSNAGTAISNTAQSVEQKM
jgi:predicted small secreted protein